MLFGGSVSDVPISIFAQLEAPKLWEEGSEDRDAFLTWMDRPCVVLGIVPLDFQCLYFRPMTT